MFQTTFKSVPAFLKMILVMNRVMAVVQQGALVPLLQTILMTQNIHHPYHPKTIISTGTDLLFEAPCYTSLIWPGIVVGFHNHI